MHTTLVYPVQIVAPVACAFDPSWHHDTMRSEASDSTPVAREPGGKWAKGQSGNPGGRRKSLAPLIQAATRDGQELVDRFVALFTADPLAYDGLYAEASIADRIKAGQWLSEHGFGKPVTPLAGDEERPPIQVSFVTRAWTDDDDEDDTQ